MSIQTSEQAELERLMKRLQIGTTNYNAANDLHAECYGTIGRMAGELERLRAEVAALRTDAERYHWLRNVAQFEDWEFIGSQTSDNMDAAIDAAIRAKEFHNRSTAQKARRERERLERMK